MQSKSLWLLLVVIGPIFMALVGYGIPSIKQMPLLESALSSAGGVLSYWAVKGLMSSVKSHVVQTAHEAKIFNEQLKLMATSLNAIALAVLAVGLVQPAVNNLPITAQTAILTLFGVFLHTRVYGLLACMKEDP